MGLNNFIALSTIPIGAATGPQPAVDLWALVPDTGLNPGFTAICAGLFQGSIFLEGSLNGVNFAPIGIQPDQALNLGLSAAQLGAPSSFSLGLRSSANQAPSSFELTPLIIPNVVRYVRANIAPGTLVTGPVIITLGGEQNCACSSGGTSDARFGVMQFGAASTGEGESGLGLFPSNSAPPGNDLLPMGPCILKNFRIRDVVGGGPGVDLNLSFGTAERSNMVVFLITNPGINEFFSSPEQQVVLTEEGNLYAAGFESIGHTQLISGTAEIWPYPPAGAEEFVFNAGPPLGSQTVMPVPGLLFGDIVLSVIKTGPPGPGVGSDFKNAWQVTVGQNNGLFQTSGGGAAMGGAQLQITVLRVPA